MALAETTGAQMTGARGNVAPFPAHASRAAQVGFERSEIERIMGLYGRMVAQGHWRDYALSMERDVATFAAFRRASERPQYRVEKRPADRRRQGMWTLFGEHGQILKRGHELRGVLAPVERKFMRAVD